MNVQSTKIQAGICLKLVALMSPDSSGFQEGEPDLHEEDDDAHDDQEEGVRVDHQRLQLCVDVDQRRRRCVRGQVGCDVGVV